MTGILQVRDMFGPVVRERTSAGEDFYHYDKNYDWAPQVSVTVNYRFNNYKSKSNQSRGDGGDEF